MSEVAAMECRDSPPSSVFLTLVSFFGEDEGKEVQRSLSLLPLRSLKNRRLQSKVSSLVLEILFVSSNGYLSSP